MTIEDQTQTQAQDSVEGTTETEGQEQVVETAEATNPELEVEAQGDDSFSDPNAVPDELMPKFKSLQADYTKKMQALAEERKQAEEWKQQAEEYKKLQPHLPIVEQLIQQQQQAAQTPEMAEMEQQYRAAGYDEESIKFMKMGIGFALGHINQTQSTQREMDRITGQIQQAATVDPRLNDNALVYQTEEGSVTFGQIVERMVESDPNWRRDPIVATRKAIKVVDALIGKSKTDGKEELSNAAKAKAQKFPQSQGSPQSATSSGQALTFRDAARAAEKETGIRLK